jgi:DNA-binding MarR family transcriptional regulator
MVMFHYAAAERLGLGPTDWKTLGLLEQHGPMTAGDLAKWTKLAPASVTGIIDRLERGGWLERRPHDEDRRRVVIGLVAKEDDAARDVLFGPLLTRLEELYSGYTVEQLAFLAEALEAMAKIQSEAIGSVQTGRS